MLLTRKYHFYAAHRNQELCDQCRNIHGHQYEVRVTFDLEVVQSNITVLFAKLDEMVTPIIKEYDHGMIIHIQDPLYAYLLKFPEPLKFKVFHEPTSVENLTKNLYKEIKDRTLFNVCAVEVDETKSSTLRYTTEDYNKELAAGYTRLCN